MVPGSGSASPTDDPFVARVQSALIDHGLSEYAAHAAHRTGVDLAFRTRASRREWAALVDVESGADAGSLVEGGRRGVAITPLLAATVRGRTYVQIHSHPASTAFSLDDVLLLNDHRQIGVVAVVGTDAT